MQQMFKLKIKKSFHSVKRFWIDKFFTAYIRTKSDKFHHLLFSFLIVVFYC